jgi:hypothetical protein
LYKKARGREARLGYLGHVLLEHRSGLIVRATVTPADGHGERDAALVMIEGFRDCSVLVQSAGSPLLIRTRFTSSRLNAFPELCWREGRAAKRAFRQPPLPNTLLIVLIVPEQEPASTILRSGYHPNRASPDWS